MLGNRNYALAVVVGTLGLAPFFINAVSPGWLLPVELALLTDVTVQVHNVSTVCLHLRHSARQRLRSEATNVSALSNLVSSLFTPSVAMTLISGHDRRTSAICNSSRVLVTFSSQ